MALGVEYGAKYTLTGPDGTIAVFNDSTDPNFVGVLSPESSGLDSPDVREDAQERTEDDGGIHGDFYYGRRPVVLQGTIIASSATQRAERIEKLTRASNAMRADATLKWKPAGAGEELELKLRRQQPLRITKGFVKDFQAAMVSADAFLRSAVTSTLKASGAVTTSTFSPGEVAEEFVGEGTVAWTNVNNAKASDNVYATCTLNIGQGSRLLIAKNFNPTAIPEDAILTAVKAKIERKASANVLRDQRLMVRVEGSRSVIAFSGPNWPLSDEVAEYELLKEGNLTPKKLKVATTGYDVAVENNGGSTGTGSVDSMLLTVSWIPAITMSIENKGNSPASPTVWLSGPMTNPTIKNVATGEVLTLTYTLPKEKYLRIDWRNHTIYLYDKTKTKVESVYSALQFTQSSWFAFKPGITEIYVTGASTTEAAVEVEWQNAWV